MLINKNLVLAAATASGIAAIICFRCDAVMENEKAYRRANEAEVSEELLADKEVMMAAVKKNGHMLEYASEELQSDKEVVLAAVAQKGDALCYASEGLRGDKEVMIAAAAVK